MSSFVNTLLPDPIDNASTREELIQKRSADQTIGMRHDYIILYHRDGETQEDRFVGTPTERKAHMQDVTIERDGEKIAPLGLSLETDSWAAASFDWRARKWNVSGTNVALRHRLETEPYPHR